MIESRTTIPVHASPWPDKTAAVTRRDRDPFGLGIVFSKISNGLAFFSYGSTSNIHATSVIAMFVTSVYLSVL